MALRRIESESDKSDLVPLIQKYLKQNPHLSDHPFFVNRIQESKNGEWMILYHQKKFCALIHVESNQWKDSCEEIDEAHMNGWGVYVIPSNKYKSGVEIAIDQEVETRGRTSEEGMVFAPMSALAYIPEPPPTTPIPTKKTAKKTRTSTKNTNNA